MAGPDIDRRKVGIYLGLGIGLAATTGIFMALGHFADRWAGTGPLFTVLGAFLGGALGFYNLYRQAVAVGDHRSSDDRTVKPSDELPEHQRTDERETP